MATTSAPPPKTNRIGLAVLDYRGGKTTLCAGCGHNAISERIIDAFYEMGIKPERVAKLSGIGCSSKSPAYFMSRSASFNWASFGLADCRRRFALRPSIAPPPPAALTWIKRTWAGCTSP